MSQKIDDLLLKWEDHRRSGKTTSIEELCRDCPDLREQLRVRVQALEKMNQVLNLKTQEMAQSSGRRRTRYDDLRPNGELVPGYRLEKLLGKGGFGEVWKAIGPGGFAVAMKFVSLSSSLGASEVRSLEVIKTLHHPNLLAVFGSWQIGGFLVIAMELADRTLQDRLNEAIAQGLTGIPDKELLAYMQEAAKGIDYLNQPSSRTGDSTKAAIQHRDIKPQNILLMGGGIKIGDFGLLRILKTTLTEHTGSLTLAYAAPEFLKGSTARTSDQYSLAVTYCHLCGGRLPFVGNPAQVMDGHLKEAPDLTMIPEAERGPVGKALQKDPARRWSSCGEFVGQLREKADQDTKARERLAGQLSAMAKLLTGRRIIVGAVSIAAFLIVLLVALWPRVGDKIASTEVEPGNRKDAIAASPQSDERNKTELPRLELDLGQGVRIKLVRIKSGRFRMGQEKRGDDEWPHEVTISRPFFMGATLVTQGQYRQVMGINPSAFKHGDDFPVECITWHDALEFCRKSTEIVKHQSNSWVFDLPTEAQWEYACRAGTTTPYSCGTSISSDNAHFRAKATAKVGSYPPNQWGLYDMPGNLHQWCKDWLDLRYYKSSHAIEPQGPVTGTRRVVRSGQFADGTNEMRSAWRHGVPPGYACGQVGFRVVLREQ